MEILIKINYTPKTLENLAQCNQRYYRFMLHYHDNDRQNEIKYNFIMKYSSHIIQFLTSNVTINVSEL